MALSAERTALISFIGSAVLAGGNAVGIRFSNRELAPLWGAGLRFSLAALLLLAIMAVMRLPVPRGRVLLGVLMFGLLNFGGAFALAYYSLVRIHAGLGQTLLALVPLVTLFLAVLQHQEKLRTASLIGALLAIAGVAVMARAPVGGSVPPLSLLAVLGSVMCLAQAAILAHRIPHVHPVTMNALGMAVGALFLLAGSLIAGEPHVLPRHTATWVAIGYLVTIGSVGVFVLYLVVLQYWTASRAAYVFVIIPLVAVVLSAWLDGEPITIALAFGGMLVLAGVYVGALRET